MVKLVQNPDVMSSVIYVRHHCQQQEGAHVFTFYILQTTSPEVPR